MGSRAPEPDAQDRWKTIAWLIGPLAVVGIVAFMLFRPTSDAPVSHTSGPSQPVAVATPTPFPAQVIQPVDVASLDIRSAPFERGATVADFALAGERVIAAGSDSQGPAAWYSDDQGQTWKRASVTTLGPPQRGAVADMAAVAAHGGTLVAVGKWHLPGRGSPGEGQPLALATFLSTDAGGTWVEQQREDANGRGPAAVGQFLTADEMGFVTVRFTSYPTFLQSPDGVRWEEMEQESAIAKAQLRNIVGRGDTLVAAGLDTSSRPPTFLTPDAWTYTEATGWTTYNDRFNGAIVGDLLADASGFYAAGMVLPDPETSAGSIAAIWESEDGTSWQQQILSQSLDRETGPIAHGSLGTLVTGDALLSAAAPDGAAPTQFAWFVPNDVPDGAAQEYPITWSGRAAVALPDRFLVFGVCPQETTDCTGPAMLTFTASDKQYEAPR